MTTEPESSQSTVDMDGVLKALQHEVQRKLGRCMLRLQQYERSFKAMVAGMAVPGPIERLQAVQEHAELLAKEKRATREAMQKALALQAEAREKIAQSEALLAQYGLADVAPQPTPAPEASKAAPIGEFGL